MYIKRQGVEQKCADERSTVHGQHKTTIFILKQTHLEQTLIPEVTKADQMKLTTVEECVELQLSKSAETHTEQHILKRRTDEKQNLRSKTGSGLATSQQLYTHHTITKQRAVS